MAGPSSKKLTDREQRPNHHNAEPRPLDHKALEGPTTAHMSKKRRPKRKGRRQTASLTTAPPRANGRVDPDDTVTVSCDPDMPAWLKEADEALPPTTVVVARRAPVPWSEVSLLLEQKAALEGLLREAHARQQEQDRCLSRYRELKDAQEADTQAARTESAALRRLHAQEQADNASLRLQLQAATSQVERLAATELKLCQHAQAEAETREHLSTARDENAKLQERNGELTAALFHAQASLVGGGLARLVGASPEQPDIPKQAELPAAAVCAAVASCDSPLEATPRRKGLTKRTGGTNIIVRTDVPLLETTSASKKRGAQGISKRLESLQAAIANKENQLMKMCGVDDLAIAEQMIT